MEKIIKYIRFKTLGFLLFLIFTTFVLRYPSFLTPVIDEDEATYYTIAKIINSGGLLYRDAVDLKPPLLYFLYAIALRIKDSMYFVHFLTTLWIVTTSLIVKNIITINNSNSAAKFAAILYILYSSTFSFDSLATNGEILMNLPLAISVFYFIKFLNTNKIVYILISGLFCGTAIMIKYQATTIVIAFFIILLINLSRTSYKLTITKLYPLTALVLGTLIPILFFILLFERSGNLKDAYYWSWKYNFIFMEGFSYGFAFMRFLQVFPTILLCLSGLFLGFYIYIRQLRYKPFKNTNARARLFCAVFVLTSFIGICIGGKFYTHYFIQLILPLVLISSITIYGRIFTKQLSLVQVTLIFLTFFIPLISWIRIIQYDFPKKAHFNKSLEEIGKYINTNSTKNSTIFIWGRAPEIYVFSKRLPASRFVMSNFIVGMNSYNYGYPLDNTYTFNQWNKFKDELFFDLEKNKPTYFIDTSTMGLRMYQKYSISNFIELQHYLDTYYIRETQLSGVIIYRYTDNPSILRRADKKT